MKTNLPPSSPVYDIIVGNIGHVGTYEDLEAALVVFIDYVSQSLHGYGRASGETVSLFQDGELIKDYNPPTTLT